jgi:hypothetical protein
MRYTPRTRFIGRPNLLWKMSRNSKDETEFIEMLITYFLFMVMSDELERTYKEAVVVPRQNRDMEGLRKATVNLSQHSHTILVDIRIEAQPE